MRLIALTSTNPVKVQATKAGFQRMFPGETFQVELVKAPSGVSDQPASDAETFTGALNRALGASRLHPQADFWVGIEGGVQECAFEACAGELMAFAWVVVLKSEGGGMKDEYTAPVAQPARLIGKGRTGTFFLPQEVARLVRQGVELGEADDAVFGRSNSKQENGAVGLLTGNVIDRAGLYEQAVALALIPFRNVSLYGIGDRDNLVDN